MLLLAFFVYNLFLINYYYYYSYVQIDATLIILFTFFGIRNILPLKYSVPWLEAKMHLHSDAVEIWYKSNGGCF